MFTCIGPANLFNKFSLLSVVSISPVYKQEKSIDQCEEKYVSKLKIHQMPKSFRPQMLLNYYLPCHLPNDSSQCQPPSL